MTRALHDPGDLIARRRERPAPSATELLDDILDRTWDDGVPNGYSAVDMLDRAWRDPWVDEREEEEHERGL